MADNKNVWVGFDLGGTKMCAYIFDEAFNVLASKKQKTKANEGMDAGFARVFDTIRGALADAAVGAERIAGIGVGYPGPLDYKKGVILQSPNLGWVNAPLKKALQAEFKRPAAIINDVDAGTYGEYRFGAGSKGRCVIGVFPGTGIGGGCIYNGQILMGAKSSIMEIGHMQVINDGPLCGCGRTGCVEAVASRLAIAAAAAAAAQRGAAPWLQKNVGSDIANIRSGSLAEAIKKGDKAVETIVRLAAQWLGVAVGNVVNLLGPDRVILGGGLVEAMPVLFREEVARSARERAMPSLSGTFKVLTAKLGDRATAQGAAAWAQHCQAAKGK